MSDSRRGALSRGLLLGMVIAAFSMSACQKQQNVTAPPPKGLPTHGPGEVDPQSCNQTTGHGMNYKPVACPDACASTVTDHKWVVDDYIDNPVRDNDPDFCLHGANDTMTYLTNKSGRTIQVVRFESGAGNPGHPFMDNNAPPYPSTGPAASAKTGIMDPHRRPPAAGKKCYEFEAYIRVRENGKDRCFDPHIYTDCLDSTCVQ